MATNYRITVVYIAICAALKYTATAEQHVTGSERGKTSNYDAFVTIDNILMDEDDQISTNSKADDGTIQQIFNNFLCFFVQIHV